MKTKYLFYILILINFTSTKFYLKSNKEVIICVLKLDSYSRQFG